MMIALIFIAAALAGLWLFNRFFTKAAEDKRNADNVRETGGILAPNRGMTGPDLGSAFASISDALSNGIGHRQKETEARRAIIATDVTNQLVAQIQGGEFYLSVFTAGRSVQIKGDRDIQVLVHRERARALNLSATDLLASMANNEPLSPTAWRLTPTFEWDIDRSPDEFLASPYVILNPRCVVEYGGMFGQDVYGLRNITGTGAGWPNLALLKSTYLAWQAANAAKTGIARIVPKISNEQAVASGLMSISSDGRSAQQLGSSVVYIGGPKAAPDAIHATRVPA